LIINWDSEINGWSIGIAALSSKKVAKRYAGGYFPSKEQIALTTNLGNRISVKWFMRELNTGIRRLEARYGPQDHYAIAVDARRLSVYRWILQRKGWKLDHIFISNGEGEVECTECMYLKSW
jgi:hypothetical protein